MLRDQKKKKINFSAVKGRYRGFPGGSGKELRTYLPRRRCRLDPWIGKIPLEKEMATHSSILTWETPWTEEPGRLQSMGSQRVGHDLVTKQQQRVGSE